MALGENIRKRREELRLSQGYVAEQLGVSRQAVSKWETGQSEPTAGNLVQLAEVFGISLSELVEPQRDSGQQSPSGEERAGKKPNLILRGQSGQDCDHRTGSLFVHLHLDDLPVPAR